MKWWEEGGGGGEEEVVNQLKKWGLGSTQRGIYRGGGGRGCFENYQARTSPDTTLIVGWERESVYGGARGRSGYHYYKRDSLPPTPNCTVLNMYSPKTQDCPLFYPEVSKLTHIAKLQVTNIQYPRRSRWKFPNDNTQYCWESYVYLCITWRDLANHFLE